MNRQLINILSVSYFCLFLFLLPFQVWSETVFPSQTGKILFAGWAVPVLSIILCLNFLLSKPAIYKISSTDIGVCIYVLFYLAHLILIKPVNPHPFVIIEIFVLITVYLFVRLQSVKELFWILNTLCAAAFLQAVIGILQHFHVISPQHTSFNITGTFFNPAPFAGYLATVLPVILGMFFYFLKHKQIKYHLIFLPGIILVLAALILSKSRAAWLAGAISIFYLLWLKGKSVYLSFHLNKFSALYKFQNLKFRKLFAFVILAILLIAGVFKLYSIRPESANGRLLVWKSTALMIADNPVAGVGAGQFAANYMHYQAKYFQNHNNTNELLLADNTIFAFNEFIRLTAEMGITGLLLVLLMLFVIFRPGKNIGLSFIVARSGILSILIFSLLSYPGSVLPIKVLFVSFAAMIAVQQKKHSISIPEKAKTRKSIKLLVAVAFTGLLFVGVQNLTGLTIACRNWKTASDELKSNRYETGIEECVKAFPYLKTDGFFMILYGNLLKNSGDYNGAVNILETAAHLLPISDVYLSLGDCYLEQQKFDKAENAYRYALQMVPSRIKPVYNLAKLYMQTGNDHEALCIIDKYLAGELKKRTMASYEIELTLIELKREIETVFK